LLLQILLFLLGDGDGIGTGDETAWRGLRAGERDECLCELGWITGLTLVLSFMSFPLGSVALDVVRDGRLGAGH
jgi:hypothetical protein